MWLLDSDGKWRQESVGPVIENKNTVLLAYSLLISYTSSVASLIIELTEDK